MRSAGRFMSAGWHCPVRPDRTPYLSHQMARITRGTVGADEPTVHDEPERTPALHGRARAWTSPRGGAQLAEVGLAVCVRREQSLLLGLGERRSGRILLREHRLESCRPVDPK